MMDGLAYTVALMVTVPVHPAVLVTVNEYTPASAVVALGIFIVGDAARVTKLFGPFHENAPCVTVEFNCKVPPLQIADVLADTDTEVFTFTVVVAVLVHPPDDTVTE